MQIHVLRGSVDPVCTSLQQTWVPSNMCPFSSDACPAAELFVSECNYATSQHFWCKQVFHLLRGCSCWKYTYKREVVNSYEDEQKFHFKSIMCTASLYSNQKMNLNITVWSWGFVEFEYRLWCWNSFLSTELNLSGLYILCVWQENTWWGLKSMITTWPSCMLVNKNGIEQGEGSLI